GVLGQRQAAVLPDGEPLAALGRLGLVNLADRDFAALDLDDAERLDDVPFAGSLGICGDGAVGPTGHELAGGGVAGRVRPAAPIEEVELGGDAGGVRDAHRRTVGRGGDIAGPVPQADPVDALGVRHFGALGKAGAGGDGVRQGAGVPVFELDVGE